MFLSVSRRTDIPAFYLDWFMNRLRARSVCVRNPMNPRQVSRVSLAPEGIDGIAFWTKDPRPLLARLGELSEHTCVFHITVTGYGRDIEPGIPDKRREVIPAVRRLAEAVGPERVLWRYDPILFNDRYTPSYHLRAFAQIAASLRGCTEKCIVSFVDTYRWNAGRLADLGCRNMRGEELTTFAAGLSAIAADNGMAVASCAEAIDLSAAGIARGACIDPALFEGLTGKTFRGSKDPGQRPACLCAQSVDVGAYNTCAHGCAYCYAARGGEAQLRHSRARYDPEAPILCDALTPEDRITERAMKPLLDGQGSLLDGIE